LKDHFFPVFHTPPIRLALATAARNVSQHWSGLFSRNKDQNALSGGSRLLVVVDRPKNSDTMDTFGRANRFFNIKCTVSGPIFLGSASTLDQNDKIVPVRTVRDTVGHSRFVDWGQVVIWGQVLRGGRL
jgi:hypothetical protein